MTKWVLIVGGTLLGLGVLVTLVGLALPREHHVSSQVTLRQPPESVWAVVRDMGKTATWWPDVKDVRRQIGTENREVWVETAGNGFAMSLEVTREVPPSELQTTILTEAGAPFGGSWTQRIEPTEKGSIITVTEDGWVANPVFRTISRAMGYHRTLDSYLKALGAKLGEETQPRHVVRGGPF
jgi:uncharacterized protein YndB with AHSA1/START domain